MSPAGSGSGQFRGVPGGRVDRGSLPAPDHDPPEPHEPRLTLQQVQSLLSASMRTWMVPWLFPVGLLGTVALISLANVFGYLLATVWGWLVFPYVAAYVRSHSRAHRCAGNGHGFREVDAHYWRTKLM